MERNRDGGQDDKKQVDLKPNATWQNQKVVRIPEQGNLGWKVGAHVGPGSADRRAGLPRSLWLCDRGVSGGMDAR